MEPTADSSLSAEPSHRPRRRLRFSVRTLLVLVLILGAALGWVADKLRRARRQHEASVAVVSRHGTVDYGKAFRLESWGKLPLGPPPRHVWLREHLGDDLFETVTHVAFFRQPEVTDLDMAVLDAFPDLEEFHVSKAPVTDKGIAHLAGMKKLRRVTISEAPITDSSLLAIGRLPHLDQLDLNGTRITDAGLVALDAMPHLLTLDLQWTRITDAGLVHLAGLKELRFLQLGCTEITDVGLDDLRGLKSLKYLGIAATRVTSEGKASIEAALPGCNVTWWRRHGELSEAGGRPEIPEPRP
jgi:Leucine Rich repeat